MRKLDENVVNLLSEALKDGEDPIELRKTFDTYMAEARKKFAEERAKEVAEAKAKQELKEDLDEAVNAVYKYVTNPASGIKITVSDSEKLSKEEKIKDLIRYSIVNGGVLRHSMSYFF